MTDFDEALELCCDGCLDARVPRGYEAYLSDEPPTLQCVAQTCPVDVDCLRRLEAVAELAAAFLAGVLTVDAPAFELFSEGLTDLLEDQYEAARCAHTALKLQIVQKAQERAVKARSAA